MFEKLNSDSTLKDFLDEAQKEKKELNESYQESKRQAIERKKKKSPGQLESKMIKKRANQWCKNNGYSIP